MNFLTPTCCFGVSAEQIFTGVLWCRVQQETLCSCFFFQSEQFMPDTAQTRWSEENTFQLVLLPLEANSPFPPSALKSHRVTRLFFMSTSALKRIFNSLRRYVSFREGFWSYTLSVWFILSDTRGSLWSFSVLAALGSNVVCFLWYCCSARLCSRTAEGGNANV